MVSPSTPQLTPIPINTGMDDAPPIQPAAAQNAVSDMLSFATRLKQVGSPRPADTARRRDSVPNQEAEAPEKQDDPSSSTTETTHQPSAKDASTPADKSPAPAAPIQATQDGNSSPALYAGLLPPVPAHQNVPPQPQSALPAVAAPTASTAPPAVAASSTGLIGAKSLLVSAEANASLPNIASQLTSLSSGSPMDSHASPQAPASGIGIATPPSATSATPVGQKTASQLNPATPAPASTAAALPFTAGTRAAAAPVSTVIAPLTTAAPAAPLHQAQAEQTTTAPIPVNANVQTELQPPATAQLTVNAGVQSALQPPATALPNGANSLQAITMQTGNAGDQTAVAAAGAPASTTAAQRLNGIDRLFSLQGQQPVRTAVTATTPLRPKTTAPEIVPQPTDGPSLAAERSPETRSYAVPQSLLPTQTGQAASPAAPRLSSRSAAPATTQEPAPLNPPTAASRAAVLPPPTGNAPAGMTTGKAFVPVTVDPTATGETASAIGLTPDTAAGSLAAVQTAAVQAQAAKGVGPAHENVDGAVLPEANLHPSTGALNAITAAAVTAAQSGSGADANAGGGPQERSSSGAPQADASQAGISGVAGTASTVESASGATAGTSSTGTPIDNAQVIAQVTRHIETMRLLNGRGEITLQLQPDHLGSVRMTITNHADGVTAHIVTESSQAQQVMQNAGTQLHTALEARGLRLTAFDVSVGNGAANAGAGHGTPQDTPQDRAMRGFAGTRNSGRNLSAIDEVNAAAPDPVSPGGAGTLSTSSRLDYRA